MEAGTQMSDTNRAPDEGRLSRGRAPRDVDKPLLKWLWHSYLKPQRWWLGGALFFMAVEGSMLGALSYVIQPMFDEVFIAGDRDAVYWVAALVGGIFLIRAFAAFTHRTLMQGAGLRIITTMRASGNGSIRASTQPLITGFFDRWIFCPPLSSNWRFTSSR